MIFHRETMHHQPYIRLVTLKYGNKYIK